MKNHRDCLLGEIEAGALDSRTPIGNLLRKVIALGGKADSADLRDWANRELKGYGPDDELPLYRKITAPLQIDAGAMHGFIKGQMISPMDLPDFAHVNLDQSVDQIEAMVRRCEPGDVVKLSPPDSQGLVTLMNAGGEWRGHIERMYWGVSPAVLEGVVDQVRTALINLVAEITAHMPEGVDTPSPEVATNAVNFLVTGERHKISFSAPQAGTALAARPPEEHPGAGCELLQPSSSASPRSLECSSQSWKHKAGVSNARRPSRIQYRSSQEDR